MQPPPDSLRPSPLLTAALLITSALPDAPMSPATAAASGVTRFTQVASLPPNHALVERAPADRAAVNSGVAGWAAAGEMAGETVGEIACEEDLGGCSGGDGDFADGDIRPGEIAGAFGLELEPTMVGLGPVLPTNQAPVERAPVERAAVR